MPAHINHNVHLKQVSRNLNLHFAGAARQVEKLASGKRINRSSDDPASLALANAIHSEVRVLAEGGRNVQQSVHLLQVAEGALSEISNMLQRMQELASQAASATYSDVDRGSINIEFSALKAEIERIANFATYNGVPLLNSDREFAIQAGPSEASNDVSRIRIGDMRVSGPNLDIDSLTTDSLHSGQEALDRLQLTQEKVLSARNRISAFQNRLQLSAETTTSIIERMVNSESEVRDADVARSMSELTRSQIMVQTASSFALEADAEIEQILSLLQ